MLSVVDLDYPAYSTRVTGISKDTLSLALHAFCACISLFVRSIRRWALSFALGFISLILFSLMAYICYRKIKSPCICRSDIYKLLKRDVKRGLQPLRDFIHVLYQKVLDIPFVKENTSRNAPMPTFARRTQRRGERLVRKTVESPPWFARAPLAIPRVSASCARFCCNFVNNLVGIVWVDGPMPYDEMKLVDEGTRALTLAPMSGHIIVRMRFRSGTLAQRRKRSGQYRLAPTTVSLAKHVPLEEDGSLSADRIKEAFHTDGVITIVIPNSTERLYLLQDQSLSPITLHTLLASRRDRAEIDFYEYEDMQCTLRRRFRQWLRTGAVRTTINRVQYALNFIGAVMVDMLLMHIAIEYLGPSRPASELEPSWGFGLWKQLCYFVGTLVFLVGFMKYHRRECKDDDGYEWVNFPTACGNDEFWLNEDEQNMFLY